MKSYVRQRQCRRESIRNKVTRKIEHGADAYQQIICGQNKTGANRIEAECIRLEDTYPPILQVC